MRKKSIFLSVTILALLFLLFVPSHIFTGYEVLGNSSSVSDSFLNMLTIDEREYLNTSGPITALLSVRKGPIQYIDKSGTQRGISVDLLNEISSLTGMQFNILTVESMPQIQGLINDGTAHIVAGLPREQTVKDAYDVDFTSDYLNCSYGIIIERGSSFENIETLTLALTTGLDVPAMFADVKEVKHFDSIQDCISAVKSGTADFTYGNSYVLEFYSQGYAFQNLCVIPLPGKTQNICFGISHHADVLLTGILNKAIDCIGSDRLLEIMVTNVATSTQSISLASIISANPVTSIFCVLLLIVLIITTGILFVRNSNSKNKLMLMEHQRYLLVSSAAKDFYFEYQYKNDTLLLSNDLADLFGSRSVIRRWSAQLSKYSEKHGFSSEEFSRMLSRIPLKAEGAPSTPWHREVRLMSRNREERWYSVTLLGVYDNGDLSHAVGKLTDIQEKYEEREKLMQKSLSDSLTGLYNVAAVHDLVSRFLESNRNGSFFMMDLDHFKDVNDRYGHQKGDSVLTAFADILKRTFRSEDILGRVGGDEFIVFTKDATDENFIAAKCALIKKLTSEIDVCEGYTQTVSIGIAKATPHIDFETLYHDADSALYTVKNSCRGGYSLYNPSKT